MGLLYDIFNAAVKSFQPKASSIGYEGSSLGYEVGALAEKYETGGTKGVGFISNGASWGDPGGDSYGSYQLETKKGTMSAYLKTKDVFTDALRPLKMNSKEFKAKWKELALKNPREFQESQFNYLASKPNGHYDALRYAERLGWRTDNFALKSAIFSTSNQSGGWKKIFNDANIYGYDNITTQINKLYDARARYFSNLSSLTATIKKNIIRERTVNERRDCLELLK